MASFATPPMSAMSANRFSNRSARWDVGLLVVLLVLYLLRLGSGPLFDVDEGAFSEATREMLSSHDWGHTTLNGTDRFDKPILVYWLQAAAMTLLGVNEWGARLPSALCTVAAALAIARFGSERFETTVGRMAGIVFATSLGFLIIGRAATADGLLNALIVVTGLSLWRFAENGDTGALVRAYAWAGLGLLAKGPVAVLVPGAALVLWSLTTDGGRTAFRAALSWRGWALMLLIAVPWYAYALNRHGMAFVDGFIMKHNVGRFSGAMEGHGGGIAYYAMMLPLLVLPWAPMLAWVLLNVRRLWAERLTRYLLLWAGFVIVFFSLSGTKLPHYVLYGCGPLALLIALALRDASKGWRAAVWVCLALELALFASSPWLAAYAGAQVQDPWYGGLLRSAGGANGLVWAAGAGALAAMALWRRGAPLLRLGLGALAVSAVFVGFAVPWWAQALQSPMPHAAQWARAHHLQPVQWRLHQPTFAFYLGQPTPELPAEAGRVALARVDMLKDAPLPYDTLFEERGMSIVRFKAKAP